MPAVCVGDKLRDRQEGSQKVYYFIYLLNKVLEFQHETESFHALGMKQPGDTISPFVLEKSFWWHVKNGSQKRLESETQIGGFGNK